jgi:hypothetical protein
LEVQHAAKAAARMEGELKGTIDKLTEQIEMLRSQPSNAGPILDKLTQTTEAANNQIVELGKANNAVTNAISNWPSFEHWWVQRNAVLLDTPQLTHPSD